MRLHLKTSPSTQTVPFDYASKLVGAIHKWLGQNNYHDGMSLYSFSTLHNGRATKTGLHFESGSSFFISAWENEFIQQLVKGVLDAPEIAYGLKVMEVTIQQNPDLANISRFQAASPIFIKRMVNGRSQHYVHSDVEASQLLTETLQHKLKLAGILDDSLSVRFDSSYPGAKTKLITYDKIQNRTSVCPVILEGSPLGKQFAWCVGVGNSTGIGFGAIC
jgi:CRISPR-associated endoribonuclease Cas6